VSNLLLIIGTGLLLLSVLFGERLFNLVYNRSLGIEFWPYGLYSILTAFFNSYFKVATVYLVYLKRATGFLSVNLVNFFTTVCISIGGLYLYPDSLVGPLYGRLLSGLINFFIAQFLFSRQAIFCFDREFLKGLFAFCIPYALFAISGWVLGQIDRFFLQEGIPKADLNAYDLLLKCFYGIEFLQNSLLSAAIFPKVFELWGVKGDSKTSPESNRYFNIFTAINIIQLILFCLFLPIVYELIIRNEAFYTGRNFLGIVAAGYALRSIHNFYLSTILYTKKIRVLLLVFGLSALLQIVFTYFGSTYLGLNGAIYAGLATRVLQVFFCIWFTKGVFEYDFNRFKIITIPLIYLVFNVIQYVLFPDYNFWQYLLQLVAFSLLLYMVFRKEIEKVLADFSPFSKLKR
jgi:O-antigen/teichoic acid export membrane protein